MYYAHFGLDEAPFRITPHTDFFFPGAQRGAMLEALLFAVTNDEGIVKVTGEVGSGKTMLCRMLMEKLPAGVDSIYIANPLLAREDVVFAIAEELGFRLPQGRAIATMQALQQRLIERYAQGRRAVLLVDEAHAVPAQTLEEIRLLSNLESQRHKLLQIVLFGQPELDRTLAAPHMRQLKDRITQHFGLEPLRREDVAEYIDFRMRAAGYRGPAVFDAAAVRRIAQAAGGLTRRVNILADKALLAAFAAGRHQVGTRETKAAVKDARIEPRSERLAYLAGATAVVAGALAIGLGLVRYHAQGMPAAAAPAAPELAGAHASSPPAASPSPAASPLPASPLSPASLGAAETAVAQPSAFLPPGTPQSSAAQSSAAQPGAAQPPAAPATLLHHAQGLGPLTLAHLAKLAPWLGAAEDEHWFIQLATGANPRDIEHFVGRAAAALDAEALRVYAVPMSGTRRIGVIYGEYASRELALAALQTLPPSLGAVGAYPRQVRKLR